MSYIENIKKLSNSYEKNDGKFIGYGTAGFRAKEDILPPIFFRMGLLVGLKSKLDKGYVGVIITASHNPIGDNGIKIINQYGLMLENNWENIATKLANSTNEELLEIIQTIINEYSIDLTIESKVIIGRDSRDSGSALSKAFQHGFNCFHNGKILDYGKVTTPFIHYLVVVSNDPSSFPHVEKDDNDMVSSSVYYKQLANSFVQLLEYSVQSVDNNPLVILDCSNGIGASSVSHLLNELPSKSINLKVINDGSGPNDILNKQCGADFVKVRKLAPANFPVENSTGSIRGASFDGDADRIIYYYFDTENVFHMLDGDKIAVLIASHMKELIESAQLSSLLTIGLVQTAYANGSSTDYIQKTLRIPVSFTPTGVKYLHHEASSKYDCGIYFEANGHGTVVFSEKAKSVVKNEPKAKELWNFMNLINSYTGDALSDFLAVEIILWKKGWSIKNWDEMYKDYPNRLLTVKVKDRYGIKTVNAEREVIEPNGLQDEINRLVSSYPNGRSFIRPSGTEDVVRVYAEAATQKEADLLAEAVSSAVKEFC